jgi:hypothetical protein
MEMNAKQLASALLDADEPEKVVAAAILLPSGRMYSGLTHGHARDAFKRHHIKYRQGFLTDRGRFVSRRQAFRLAVKAKQMTAQSYAQAEEDLWGVRPKNPDSMCALGFDVAKRIRR